MKSFFDARRYNFLLGQYKKFDPYLLILWERSRRVEGVPVLNADEARNLHNTRGKYLYDKNRAFLELKRGEFLKANPYLTLSAIQMPSPDHFEKLILDGIKQELRDMASRTAANPLSRGSGIKFEYFDYDPETGKPFFGSRGEFLLKGECIYQITPELAEYAELMEAYYKATVQLEACIQKNRFRKYGVPEQPHEMVIRDKTGSAVSWNVERLNPKPSPGSPFPRIVNREVNGVRVHTNGMASTWGDLTDGKAETVDAIIGMVPDKKDSKPKYL